MGRKQLKSAHCERAIQGDAEHSTIRDYSVWVKGLPAHAARDAFDVAGIKSHFDGVVGGGAVACVVVLSNAGAALQLQHTLHALSQQMRKQKVRKNGRG